VGKLLTEQAYINSLFTSTFDPVKLQKTVQEHDDPFKPVLTNGANSAQSLEELLQNRAFINLQGLFNSYHRGNHHTDRSELDGKWPMPSLSIR
jgi:hypothetical protein